MRVNIYHKSVWPRYKGAIFTVVHRLSKAAGLDITFIHVAETDEIRKALGGVDLTYHQYPFRVLIRGSYEDASLARRIGLLTRDLLHHPADLVVLPGYDRIENWLMLLVCIALRRKRAVFCDSTIYDNPPVRWKSWAKRLFFSRCDGFVGYGQRSKEYLITLGANGADVIVPCVAAALPHDYDASQVLAQYRALPAATFAPPRFLYVGRLAPEKGLLDLLAAFVDVRAALPTAHLDLVGGGPMQGELEERVRALGLTQAVTLRGTLPLTEIVPEYFRSVALVLPSHREPWGLVANEALSYGCPVVVSSRCGCAPELVVDGVTGYCFEMGDVAALAQAMRAVIRLSENRAATAQRCVELMAAYSPERAGSRMVEGCTQLLALQS